MPITLPCRYQLFMQLQRDLLHGRLYCPQNQSAELAALILQGNKFSLLIVDAVFVAERSIIPAQLGDYNEVVHYGNYVSQYKLLLKQTPRLEERIAEIHKSLRWGCSRTVPWSVVRVRIPRLRWEITLAFTDLVVSQLLSQFSKVQSQILSIFYLALNEVHSEGFCFEFLSLWLR